MGASVGRGRGSNDTTRKRGERALTPHRLRNMATLGLDPNSPRDREYYIKENGLG